MNLLLSSLDQRIKFGDILKTSTISLIRITFTGYTH